MKRYCVNCMHILPTAATACPRCGFNEQENGQPSNTLRRHTLLNKRYVVGNMLGKGGFGITYIGWDLSMDRKVAIKELYPSGQASRNNAVSNQIQWNFSHADERKWQGWKNQFLTEARQMAKLDEIPGIVRVWDCFLENDTAYIVMDYVEGENLKSYLLKNGRMKYADCIRMMKPLIDGLGMVHKRGLIHRDIKPDNIMVRPDGSLVILDFGAAVNIRDNPGITSASAATKGFGALEQYMQGGRIGSWTDVYALCATIYYCVTGAVPPPAMQRASAKDAKGRKLVDKKSKRSFPLGAARILNQGTAIEPEKRIASMEQLKRKLFALKLKKTGAGAAIAAALILGTVALVHKEPVQAEKLGCTNANMYQAANYNALTGKYIYYADRDWNLYVADWVEGPNRASDAKLDDEVGYINVGDNQVYYIHDNADTLGEKDSIWKMDLDGGNRKKVVSGGEYCYLQYVRYDSGQEVLYYADQGDTRLQMTLYRYDLKEEKEEELLSEGIFWYNVHGPYIYYTVVPSGDVSQGVILKRALLDGTNPETLNEKDYISHGYIEDDMAFLFCQKKEALVPYDLDGQPCEKSDKGNGWVATLKKFGGDIFSADCHVYGGGRIYYSPKGSKEIRRIGPSSDEYEVVFEGYDILQLAYLDSELWVMTGTEEDEEYTLKQSFLVNIEGNRKIQLEETYTEATDDGLEYVVDQDRTLCITGYRGKSKNVTIPYEIGGVEVKDVRFEDMPKGLTYYYYPHISEITYEKISNGTEIALTGYDGSYTGGKTNHLTIPEEIDGLPVTELGEGLFTDQDLEGIILSSNLKKINAYAFQGCEDLSYVKMGNNLQFIEKYAFWGCKSLQKLQLPEGLKKIGAYAFVYVPVKEFLLPASLSSLAGGALSGLGGDAFTDFEVEKGNSQYKVLNGLLVSVDETVLVACPRGKKGELTVPDGIQYIHVGAFLQSKLSKLNLPDSVKGIGWYSFSAMENLKEFHLPKGVKKIPSYAFEKCSSLTNIELSGNVNEVNESAFENCNSLRKVRVKRNCQIDSEAFGENVEIEFYD